MSHRVQLSANQGWTFYRGQAPQQRTPDHKRSLAVWDCDYDDAAWEHATLPHTVREEALMCSGGRNYQGVCWYRRRFTIPADYEGMNFYFELEAAMQRVDAWLDGSPLGVRTGGFLPMQFDLTGIATGSEHVLVLRVDNSDMADVPPGKQQGALDFCYFGGLYRDAWLHIVSPVHFTSAVHAGKVASGGLFVHYRDVSAESATVSVDMHFENRSSHEEDVRVQLLLDGSEVYTSAPIALHAGEDRCERGVFQVMEPRLWHPHHPHLYQLTAQILRQDTVVDEVSERIGIRTIAFTTEGFFINGEKLFLNGANRHQEYPYVGFALPDSIQRRDVRLLRESGVISVRQGHYPQDKAFMDACDEMGVLCVIPTPGWQIHPDSVLFDERSFENTRRLIRMNRNHPSACLWEPILNETDYPEYFAKKQLEIVQEEMGEEDAWCACDSHYAYAEHYPVVYSHTPVPGKPRYIREYGDNWTEQFGPMTTLRRVRRGENISFYPGGEAAMLRSAQEHFEHYASIQLDSTLSGGAMWAGIDHNRGYEESEGAVGMLDLLRIPKTYYYLFDCQQDMALAGPKCYIANDWTESSPRDVHVYTNASAVRLFLNDRLVGQLSANESWADTVPYTQELEGVKLPEGTHPPMIFKNVPWEAGVLRAEALENDCCVAVHEVRTPEVPVNIALQPQWAGETVWHADGADLLLIHAYIQDANGTTVKQAEPLVHFTVQGDAEIVGADCSWVKANPMQAEAGVAAVLLRAGTQAGNVVLQASSPDLGAAQITLMTVPTDVKRLPGNAPTAPTVKPTYAVDKNERFSLPQSLKQEPWFRLDMGRDKPATASSTQPGTDPCNVNHGKIDRPWIAVDTTCPQWWKVDLEEQVKLTGVTIRWYNDGLWYSYQVETSEDGVNWTHAAEDTASGQSRLPVRFDAPVTARFVRINVLNVTGDHPVGMNLVEIHGEKVASAKK